MDELKLKLNTKFMKNIVAKFVQKAIFKKTGHEVSVHFDDVAVDMDADKVRLHTTVDVEMSKEEFMKLVKRML